MSLTLKLVTLVELSGLKVLDAPLWLHYSQGTKPLTFAHLKEY